MKRLNHISLTRKDLIATKQKEAIENILISDFKVGYLEILEADFVIFSDGNMYKILKDRFNYTRTFAPSLTKLNHDICSVAAYKDGKLLYQVEVPEGSTHSQRMAAILENPKITYFDFYLLPHSLKYEHENPTYLGMRPEGKSWLVLNPDDLSVIKEISIES